MAHPLVTFPSAWLSAGRRPESPLVAVVRNSVTFAGALQGVGKLIRLSTRPRKGVKTGPCPLLPPTPTQAHPAPRAHHSECAPGAWGPPATTRPDSAQSPQMPLHQAGGSVSHLGAFPARLQTAEGRASVSPSPMYKRRTGCLQKGVTAPGVSQQSWP